MRIQRSAEGSKGSSRVPAVWIGDESFRALMPYARNEGFACSWLASNDLMTFYTAQPALYAILYHERCHGLRIALCRSVAASCSCHCWHKSVHCAGFCNCHPKWGPKVYIGNGRRIVRASPLQTMRVMGTLVYVSSLSVERGRWRTLCMSNPPGKPEKAHPLLLQHPARSCALCLHMIDRKSSCYVARGFTHLQSVRIFELAFGDRSLPPRCSRDCRRNGQFSSAIAWLARSCAEPIRLSGRWNLP